jgi:hypothetical protein
MRAFRYIAVVTAIISLSACAKQESVTAAGGAPTGTDGFNLPTITAGTALPAGYKIDSGRTMIFGTDDRWTGRLSYSTKTNADDVFAFLHREMPNFGWAEMSSMRSDNSVMTFVSESTGRMAIITIQRGSMIGSTYIDMVVSPRESGKGPSGAPASPRPQAQPLK